MTPPPKHPVGTYMLFGLIGFCLLLGALSKPVTSTPPSNEPPKQIVQDHPDYTRCNVARVAKYTGLSERQVLAFILAAAQKGIDCHAMTYSLENVSNAVRSLDR